MTTLLENIMYLSYSMMNLIMFNVLEKVVNSCYIRMDPLHKTHFPSELLPSLCIP